MTDLTIKLFNKAIPTTNNLVSFENLNAIAVKDGYIIHPDVCNTEVLSWLNSQQRDYNSTFYKKWSDVINKSRFELYVDQLKHYASTYGTNYTGEVFLPESDIELPNITNFKVILPITKEEVIEKCEKMLFSGIALKQETIEDILNILSDLDHTIDANNVKNKEAKMFLFKSLNQLPIDAVEMVRYLVYISTSKTLLIKDRNTYETIKTSAVDISDLVNKFGYEKLATVFYRFKPLFLAFRSNNANRTCVNKLRKLAVTCHKPMSKGYFEQLLSNPQSISELPERLKTITNFKKIGLLQTILIRKKELANKVFVIRNQKLFIKAEQVAPFNDYLKIVYDIIYSNLVDSMKTKATTIKLPADTNLTLPVSEKSFIGNYPIGTSFDFSASDNIVGINWKDADGASDLDLSLIDIDGKKYGWNSNYKNSNNTLVYSGDMTSANPEATELFYTSKGFNPAQIRVNLYNGIPGSKFKFFIAKEKVKNMTRNYMVDPSNIIVNIDCEMDSPEKLFGVITGKQFILAQFRTGRGKVSYNSVTNLYTDYALSTLDCYLSLEKLLTDAGFIFTNNNPKIDLTKLSKDSLIDLVS